SGRGPMANRAVDRSGAIVGLRTTTQRDGAAGVQAPTDTSGSARRGTQHLRNGQQSRAYASVLEVEASRGNPLGRSKQCGSGVTLRRVRVRLGAPAVRHFRDQPF